jgi:5-methylcytosine-specific restriction enzyme subunit McrC
MLRLAHIVRSCVGLGDRVGGTRTSSFLVDMNLVFERFLESRLRDELHGRLQVDGQHRDHLDVGGHVSIRPDLLFRDLSGAIAFVGTRSTS